MLKNCLLDFEEALKQHNYSLFQEMNSGLEKEHIDQLFLFNDIEVTNYEIYELYMWKNGITNDKNNFNGNFFGIDGIFLTLEECIAYHISRTKDDNLYSDILMPIFETDSYLVNRTEAQLPVYYYCPSVSGPDPIHYFDSLELMFQSLTEMIYVGAVYWENSVGYEDYELSSKIIRKYNPKSKFYT